MAAKRGILKIKRLEDTFMPMLRRCNNTTELKRIHALMEKFSLLQSNFLVTRMLNICDQSGEIGYASLLFKRVPNPNIFLYNAMLRTYTHKHMYIWTLHVYKEMVDGQIYPDRFTFPFVIRSCGGLLSVWLGRQVHGHACKFGSTWNNMVLNSLLDLYVKCDAVTEAHKVFDEMPERDVLSWNSLISGHMKLGQIRKATALFKAMPDKTIVSWTVMISGYTKSGCLVEALDLFRGMQIVGMQPDWISLVAVLPACAKLGALELGRWIHFYSERKGFLRNRSVCNALIEMYAKCGGMDQAMQLFRSMPDRDVITWSSMISGLAHHGQAHEAIALFHDMQKAKVEPNEITFIGLLSACAHAGLLDEGFNHFNSMQKDHGIEPGIEHYGCMVDLLGRTGKIALALEFIRSMKMAPGSAIWGSLLSSCRTHGDLETAVIAMEQLLELEPDDMGNVVLLANIYADSGRWDGVATARKAMRKKRKTAGCSLVEMNGLVEEFTSGDEVKVFGKKGMLEIMELLDVEMRTTIDDYLIWCL